MHSKLIAGSIALAMLTQPFSMAFASSQHDNWAKGHMYVGAFFVNPDDDRGTDGEGEGFQANIGWRLTPHLALEGQIFSAILETGPGNVHDFYHRGLGLDLQYGFGDREQVTPFVLLGLGLVDNDVVPDSQDDTTLFVNAGLGLVGRLFDLQWLRWRVEGRYQHDEFMDGVADWRVGGGIEVAFARQMAEKIVYRDRDVVREVVRQVPPPDSDGDGVVDSYDRCPNTLRGATVNGWGCVESAQVVRLENINFALDSAQLTPDSMATIDQAARFMQQQPNIIVEIAGHTDSQGPDDYNQRLSEDRAGAVRAALLGRGVSALRMTSRGYGERQLIDKRDTEQAHAMNRRVEFRISMNNR